MTFSSASVSACDVDVVAATAAGAACLRAGGGGKAACWRVAGARAGATGAGAAAAAVAAGAVVLADVASGAVVLAAVWGTTLRAIGRGLGSGTVGLAQAASAANADNAIATSALVAKAVRRKVGAGANGVTVFLRGESHNRCSPSSI